MNVPVTVAQGPESPVAANSARDIDMVIFDCDGVVVDSELLSCRALLNQLVRHGMQLELADIYERYLGRSFAVVAEDYRRRCGRPIPDAVQTDFKAELFAALGHELKPLPAIEPILAQLDIPYCLTSSSDWDRIALSLRVTKLAAYFVDKIYTAAMVSRGKPAPDLLLHAAERMGADPRHTLVIDDSVCGVEAGKAAGMTVWGFAGGSHYAGRDGVALLTAAGADRVYMRMADVDRALRRD